jgi:hypothetical protein
MPYAQKVLVTVVVALFIVAVAMTRTRPGEADTVTWRLGQADPVRWLCYTKSGEARRGVKYVIIVFAVIEVLWIWLYE